MSKNFDGFTVVKQIKDHNMSISLHTNHKSEFLVCAELQEASMGKPNKYDELDLRKYVRTLMDTIELPEGLRMIAVGSMFPNSEGYGAHVVPTKKQPQLTELDHNMNTASMELLLERAHHTVKAQVEYPWIERLKGSDGAALQERRR